MHPQQENSANSEAIRQLTELNIEMRDREYNGDADYFEQCLSEKLIFRRADGSIVTKDDFLKGLESVRDANDNPYLQLDISVENVVVNTTSNAATTSAVVDLIVTAQRKKQPRPGVFRNIRMFEKEQDNWRLVSWVNTKVKDL